MNKVWAKISAKFSNLVIFIKSVLKEFKNLKIPTRAETMAYLVIVLIMAVICATIFFIIDGLSSSLIRKIMIWFI